MATAFWIVIGFLAVIAAIAVSYLLHRRQMRKDVKELLEHQELLDKPSQIKNSIRRYNNYGSEKESSEKESGSSYKEFSEPRDHREEQTVGGEQDVEGTTNSTTTPDEHELDGDLQVPTPSGDQQSNRSNKKRSKRNRFTPI